MTLPTTVLSTEPSSQAGHFQALCQLSRYSGNYMNNQATN